MFQLLCGFFSRDFTCSNTIMPVSSNRFSKTPQSCKGIIQSYFIFLINCNSIIYRVAIKINYLTLCAFAALRENYLSFETATFYPPSFFY